MNATSTEKLLRFMEDMQDLEDADLAYAIPFAPPSVVRVTMAKAAGRVPMDHEQLDDWALQAAIFCLNIRSDSAEAFTLVQGDVEEVTAVPVETTS